MLISKLLKAVHCWKPPLSSHGTTLVQSRRPARVLLPLGVGPLGSRLTGVSERCVTADRSQVTQNNIHSTHRRPSDCRAPLGGPPGSVCTGPADDSREVPTAAERRVVVMSRVLKGWKKAAPFSSLIGLHVKLDGDESASVAPAPSLWALVYGFSLCSGEASIKPPSTCPRHMSERETSSLPPSAWCIMEVWVVVHADYQLFIHSVILIECVLTRMCPSGHMTSIVLSILERDPPLALLKGSSPFSPWRVIWEFFLIWCEVKGQGCLCVQIEKHSEDNL